MTWNKPDSRVGLNIAGILKNRNVRIVLVVVLAPLVLLGLSLILVPVPMDRINSGYSTVVRGSDATILRAFLSGNSTYRFRTPLGEISPYLVRGFVMYEDRWFYVHPGVNPVSLARAALLDLKKRRPAAGASTITMQISRMIEPKERTVGSKLIEIFRAFQLELLFSKKKLLEIYLNMVPMGGNIEGVAAASWIYFGKDPSRLGPSEAALLIAIPKSPSMNRPSAKPDRKAELVGKILPLLKKNRIFPDGLYESSLDGAPSVDRKRLPFKAPHLCVRMQAANSDGGTVDLTLDPGLQARCESIVADYVRSLGSKGIDNTAVMVVDNRTMSVLVYVGSQDFRDRLHQGQVDGVRARRSPGSTLKPFIYSKAMDAGLLTPGSLLFDIPRSFAGYEPKNYSHQYAGRTTMRQALVRSLNVPAVETLSRLAPASMASFLGDIGVDASTAKAKNLGLSIALGAYPVSLENLVTLYAAIANGGMLKRLVYKKKDRTFGVRRIMSGGAAWLLADILSGLTRPDLPAAWEYTSSLPKVAWKTGTSFGLSDAWSVGFNPDYTIGVWLGNFSGRSSPALVGQETATPLLFKLFNEIALGSDRWFKRPPSVGSRKVCRASGLPPQDWCSGVVDEYYLPGFSSEERCGFHRRVMVDSATGREVCDSCSAGRVTAGVVIEDFPPDYAAWARQNGETFASVPRHEPSCERYNADRQLSISSPLAGRTYQVRGTGSDQALFFSADAPADAGKLFWFVDKKLVASGPPGKKVFFSLEPGRYRLTCMDDEGRSDDVEFSVARR